MYFKKNSGMLTFIVIVYFLTAAIGIYLFIKLFSNTKRKLVIGIIHGSLGLFGLACLLFYISFSKGDSPVESFLLILFALFIGGGMLATDLTGKKFPLWIAIVHIGFAVTGIYFLVSLWLK
ncbi:MAG: hypothetical protein ABIY50_06825 [Ignavibacteria bacterium]